MKAVLVFDNVNDLVFSHWDETFIERMKILGQKEMAGNWSDNDSYNVSQLFSPVVTSQRVMAAQFGNTYTFMKCKEGIKLAFDEWLDHILMLVGVDEVENLQRELMDLKTFIQHICGHNVNLLHSPLYCEWLTELLRSRRRCDCVPGATGTVGEGGALAALRTATNVVRSHCQKYHLMLYVDDKLLALYSSRGTKDLTPADIILISVQCIAAQQFWDQTQSEEDGNKDEGIVRPPVTLRLPWLSEENSAVVSVCAGEPLPCVPHAMHVARVAHRITFVALLDLELKDIAVATSTSIQILSNVGHILLQRNLESLPPLIESLETSIKKLTEALRRNKSNATLIARLATRTSELKKSCASTAPLAPLAPEATSAGLASALEAVLPQLRPDVPRVNLCEVLEHLQGKLAPYVDYLRVKAMTYFNLGSYVKEFPGLVHFVLVDRGAGRFLAPDLACADRLVDTGKVYAEVCRGLRYAREGYTSATWRRGALHACLVLWWERRGAPVAPPVPHTLAVRSLPPPGDILNAFYDQLTSLCFPSERCGVVLKELLCLHLGLLPASAAVEQARRLAHTVQDHLGYGSPDPQDLL